VIAVAVLASGTPVPVFIEVLLSSQATTGQNPQAIGVAGVPAHVDCEWLLFDIL
jgi:hypothetical protein